MHDYFWVKNATCAHKISVDTSILIPAVYTYMHDLIEPCQICVSTAVEHLTAYPCCVFVVQKCRGIMFNQNIFMVKKTKEKY